jgi:hypothetical protein
MQSLSGPGAGGGLDLRNLLQSAFCLSDAFAMLPCWKYRPRAARWLDCLQFKVASEIMKWNNA